MGCFQQTHPLIILSGRHVIANKRVRFYRITMHAGKDRIFTVQSTETVYLSLDEYTQSVHYKGNFLDQMQKMVSLQENLILTVN